MLAGWPSELRCLTVQRSSVAVAAAAAAACSCSSTVVARLRLAQSVACLANSSSASDARPLPWPLQYGYIEKIQQIVDQRQYGKSPRLMLDLDDLRAWDEELKKK